MSFNFEMPVINLDTENGEKVGKFRMERAIEMLSRSSQNYIMGVNDVTTTNSTMASLLNRSDFSQKYNDSLELLKLAYHIYQRRRI
mgnify:FL=1